MSKKKRNNGKNRYNRGSVKAIVCVNYGRSGSNFFFFGLIPYTLALDFCLS